MPAVKRRSSAVRRDPYEAVTARIIAALERGVVPWRRPWHTRGIRNAATNRPYRGFNQFLLGFEAADRGYTDSRWLTVRQANGLGGRIRSGEHGVPIAVWRWPEQDRDVDDKERARQRPFMRTFTVFNVAQCEDVALPGIEPATAFDAIAEAEAIIAGYAGGPSIAHDADRAYYVPSRDEVHLPPRELFTSADAYYATVLHELSHSTGHATRLDRAGFHEAAPFGSQSYSREELVAEFSAAFLCHYAGIDSSQLEQSASYVASWLQGLKDDRRLAVIAAGQGQRAADHILGVTPEADADTDVEHDEEATP